MRISSIMSRNVKTADIDDTVKKAAVKMNKHRIGCIIVSDGKSAVGIITERDILKKIVAAGKNAKDVKCRDIMSSPLVTIDTAAEIEDAIDIMVRRRIKKLVVTRGGHFAGILTATDIIRSGEKIENAALKKLARFFLVSDSNPEAS